jgi:isochorismate synthase EntC
MKDLLSSFMQAGVLISLSKTVILIGYGTFIRGAKLADLDTSKPAFYVSDFFLQNPQPWLQYANWIEIEVEALQKELSENETLNELKWCNPHQQLFEQAFLILQQKFSFSKLLKAVPYTFVYSSETMTVDRLKCCLAHALKNLKNGLGHMYGYWNQEGGVLGITPEILFKYQDSITVQTAALAGTCPKDTCLNHFIQDPKEREEHQLVVKGIQNDLEKFGQVRVGELQVLSLPTLNHLITPIELKLSKTIYFEELVEALHPTPALGVFPKKEGRAWLDDYQCLLNRGWYGAPVGCIYPQREISQCVVAIRNVQWDQKGMRIGAGCGVVKDSQFEKEWNEINLKMQSIRELLSL